VFEEPVEAAGEVTLEAAVCLASRFAFLESPLDVGDRGGMGAFSCDEDHVQCPVEFSVAASVEPVADGLAGRGGDRGCAGESCERGLRLDAAVV